jgi:hypothetical protein
VRLARVRVTLARAGSAARPWLALALLWVLFDAPLMLIEQAFRLTGELLLLLSLLLGSKWVSVRWLRAALAGLLALAASCLVVVRLDRAVFYWLMNEEPLLYDQLFLLRHLFVL